MGGGKVDAQGPILVLEIDAYPGRVRSVPIVVDRMRDGVVRGRSRWMGELTAWRGGQRGGWSGEIDLCLIGLSGGER